MRTLALSMVTMLVAAPLGCGGEDEVGVPQPVPIPKVSLMRSSESVGVEVLRLVGLPGAVAGEGIVYLDGGQGEVEVRSTAKGSFAAAVPYVGMTVIVRYETSVPVEFDLLTGMLIPPPAPTELMATTPITAPEAGVTTITGEALPEKEIIAVNLDNGEVVLGASDASGSFRVELPAESGDEVEVYVDSAPLGEPWRLTVP